MRSGSNYIDIWIRENEYDFTAYKTLVKWEYDKNGGNEQCPYRFDCWVVEYDINLDDNQKKLIDEELKQMDIDKIMLTEQD